MEEMIMRLKVHFLIIAFLGWMAAGLSFSAALTALPATSIDAPLSPDAGETERVSLHSNGSQGNADSNRPDLSADGRYVAFASAADNLVDNDNNGKQDIFVHDRQTGITQRVSIRTGGEEANDNSFAPAISADGNIVVFYSRASNLVNEANNGHTDIFAHNRQSGETTLVSIVLGGTANGDSRDPAVSADGRYVAFASSASNLVGNDNNFRDDIFRWDRLALVMERISVDNSGVEANGSNHSPAISGNGQHIVFVSSANNLAPGDGNNYPDIFLRDTSGGGIGEGITSRVNLADGSNAEANGDSWAPDISADGYYVAFVSLAANLVDGDDNGYADVFVRDLNLSRTFLASLAGNGDQANDWAEEPAISANGRFVTFQSFADNLSPAPPPNTRHIFIRDRWHNSTTVASVSSGGVRGNGPSADPAISANGRFVVYSSIATTLVPNDTNAARDIFAHHNALALPTLSVNFNTGAPGSYFVFSGANWLANSTAVVRANGVLLDGVPTLSDGSLIFQIVTDAGTQQGGYIITVTQGSDTRTLYIVVQAGYPLRPGAGDGLALPPGIALSEFIYLPSISR